MVRDLPLAARAGGRHPERTRVRAERTPAPRRHPPRARREVPRRRGERPRRLPGRQARREDPAHPAHHRRVPGVLHRRRQARAGSLAAPRPPRAAGSRVRASRGTRLADARRGVLARAQHHRPDGGARRATVFRRRRSTDSEQGQHRGAAALATGRGDLQRPERPDRGQRPVPGGVAGRGEARAGAGRPAHARRRPLAGTAGLQRELFGRYRRRIARSRSNSRPPRR